MTQPTSETVFAILEKILNAFIHAHDTGELAHVSVTNEELEIILAILEERKRDDPMGSLGRRKTEDLIEHLRTLRSH
jgi:hypothetical protein